jgi:hypothetical protein
MTHRKSLMLPLTRTLLVAMAAWMAGVGSIAVAQTLPLEIRQPETTWNFRSLRGVPISSVAGTPAGSDGRMTNRNESGSALLPTTNQFRGFVAFSGIPGLTSNQWVTVSNSAALKAGTGVFSSALATEMQLPRGFSNGVATIVFRRLQIGAPYLTRQVSFPFGSIVEAPVTDENGLPLSSAVVGNYWLPEPYTTNGHTNAPYYWSRHAGKVYAIQAGPISIRWIKAAYSTTVPSDYATNPGNYSVNGGNYFRLFTANYLVSGSPVKPPRRMYWTEREFRLLGKPIAVPTARVGAVNVVYNNNFPRTVTSEFKGPGQTSPTDGSTNQPLQELRTLWYDQQQGNIYAYNQEGRVFVELLGDARADGQSRESLGFEIVDVVRQPTPLDVRTELGDRILPPPSGTLDALSPEPVLQVGGLAYAYTHTVEGREATELFATRETANLNDYLVHWMETGLEGLKWPSLFGRYELRWPSDPARYSHYVRPMVASESEAKETAVALPTSNAPVIEYQDPLDLPRAKLTEDFQFYTFLDPANPLHRSLLRYTSGERIAFERVFSWLDSQLKSTQFSGNPIASQLNGWNPANGTVTFADPYAAPRVIQDIADIGQRLTPPADEWLPEDGYLAGHIKVSEGDLFDPNSYVDPFVGGFEAANRGAILPVNTLPGRDRLEVWWFRSNGANSADGFQTVHWPSVIGHYQLRWPLVPREIVLASNDGSGALTSLEAKGSVYFQNDRSLPGYNPNEEHAFMQGGQAWALRDDLNITAGSGYSSEPYVLLSYQAEDGRPAMRVFQVLREKGFDTFHYRVEAGSVLQPPMPLPLMEKPLGPKTIGSEPRSLNQEVYSRTVTASANLGGGPAVELTTQEAHHFRPWFRELALQSPNLQTVRWFFVTNANAGAKTLRGLLSDQRGASVSSVSLPALITELELVSTTTREEQAGRYKKVVRTDREYRLKVRQPVRYATATNLALTAGQKVYVVAPSLGTSWEWTASVAAPASVEVEYSQAVTLRTTDEILTAASGPVAAEVTAFQQSLPTLDDLRVGTLLFVPSGTSSPGQFVDWRLRPEPIPVSGIASQGAFTLQDRKGDLWVYRGPHQAQDAPWMGMQYYYKTMPGFFFPTLSLSEQPPAGTITPYLRDRQPDGTFAGDPVFGNRLNTTAGDNNALIIAYRPTWPASAPVLQMAETLTVPKRGLPAVRGQTSLEIVYQQSQVTSANRVSARLHDPTREKEYELGAPDSASVLGRIPDSVKTETSRGLTFFPLLPPHLSQRFFLDPNRGPHGKLVFQGQFVDDVVGDKYLHVNVLSPKDATTLSNLCLPSDPARTRWDAAVASLSTRLETFVESPQKPGTYVAQESPVTVGPAGLAEITDDEMAVDSYALTAVGPGTGYVTLIAGNGLAFTPRADPVSVLVMRVSEVLYPGELKLVASPNPLSEQLTLQQVVDLAGKPNDYEFQWKIASPVDGLPPQVYQTTPRLLLGDGTWQHVPVPRDAQDGVVAADPARVTSVSLPGSGVVPISRMPFTLTASGDGQFIFNAPSLYLPGTGTPIVAVGDVYADNRLVTTEDFPTTVTGTFRQYDASGLVEQFVVNLGRSDVRVTDLREAPADGTPGSRAQSTLFREFTVPPGSYSQLWLSLDLDTFLGARVYLNGEPVVVAGVGAQDTPSASIPAGFNALPRTYSLDPSILSRGRADGTQRVAVHAVDQRHMRLSHLAEGWIKRVLKGINPFNQRVTDLFNNRVNTDVSILTQAGRAGKATSP